MDVAMVMVKVKVMDMDIVLMSNSAREDEKIMNHSTHIHLGHGLAHGQDEGKLKVKL